MPNQTTNPLGFLKEGKDVPLGVGGDFLPSGFIGLTYAEFLWSFYGTEKSDDYEDVPEYVERRVTAGGYWYYYKKEQDAKLAIDIMHVTDTNGRKQNPGRVWNFRIKRDSVLNFADPTKLEAFSDPIALEVKYTTLRSKERYLFHMLALPFAVQAVARVSGYEYAPFEVPELLAQNIIYSDDFQKQMIGLDNDFHDAVLWQRRAALWASLGEDNPEKFLPFNKEETDDKFKAFETESKQLSYCLGIATKEWGAPLWARVISIPNPSMGKGATYEKNGETKRRLVPALYEIFLSEEDARKAAKLDIERANKNKKSDSASPASNGNHTAIPVEWTEVPEEWLAKVEELRGLHAKQPAAPTLGKLAKELSVTVDELKTVWA